MPKAKRNDDVTRLVDALKFLFRSRGMRQSDIAAALHLSQTTLKRRFAGIGLTVPFLSSMCDLAGIGLAELFEMASAATDTRVRRLSLEQEKALHADVRLGFIFSRLQLGWSADEVRQECKIPEAPLIGYLVKLERLGLIDLLPGNRVRLRTAREIDWRKHGPMWHSVDRYLKDILSMTDSDDTELSRRIAVVRLSQASIGQLDQLFHYVQSEVRRMAQDDRSAPTDEKTWYAILLGARPFEIDMSAASELPWWLRGKPPRSRSSEKSGLPRGLVPSRKK